MSEATKKSLTEAVKELGRVFVIAVIPVLIDQLNGGIDIKTILIVGSIAVLRTLDKFLHEQGKETGDTRLIGGLTRF